MISDKRITQSHAFLTIFYRFLLATKRRRVCGKRNVPLKTTTTTREVPRVLCALVTAWYRGFASIVLSDLSTKRLYSVNIICFTVSVYPLHSSAFHIRRNQMLIYNRIMLLKAAVTKINGDTKYSPSPSPFAFRGISNSLEILISRDISYI